MKNYFISILSILTMTLLLASCQNTAAGFGQDMQNTGKAITKAVNGN